MKVIDVIEKHDLVVRHLARKLLFQHSGSRPSCAHFNTSFTKTVTHKCNTEDKKCCEEIRGELYSSARLFREHRLCLSLSLSLIFVFNSNLRRNRRTKKGDQNSVSESAKLQFRQPDSCTNFVIFTAISLVEVGRAERESYNFETAKLSEDNNNNYYYKESSLQACTV